MTGEMARNYMIKTVHRIEIDDAYIAAVLRPRHAWSLDRFGSGRLVAVEQDNCPSRVNARREVRLGPSPRSGSPACRQANRSKRRLSLPRPQRVPRLAAECLPEEQKTPATKPSPQRPEAECR